MKTYALEVLLHGRKHLADRALNQNAAHKPIAPSPGVQTADRIDDEPAIKKKQNKTNIKKILNPIQLSFL